jgi:hypothetical protein
VSWSCRAGWWSGMFSAEKFSQSLSMSGPSATLKPWAPNSATSSSKVRLIGWMPPASGPAGGCGRGGRVTSIRSAARRASSAAASSARRRVSISPSSAAFSRFSAAPRSFRCSGATAPRPFSSAVSRPLFPSVPTRTASQARRSAAAASWDAVSVARAARSSPVVVVSVISSGPEQAKGRTLAGAALCATASEAGKCQAAGVAAGRAARAFSTSAAKLVGSSKAIAAITLRSSSIPAAFTPAMNWL